MEQLIKVITDGDKQAVSARDLHLFLESKRQFADWIKDRISKYEFIEGQDYMTLSLNRESGGKSIEYILTLDAAKELAMVEGNEKGKQARKYFIECEKQLKALQTRLSPAELILQQAQQLVNHERRLDDIDNRVKKIEAGQPENIKNFTIMGYANIKRTTVNEALAKQLGFKASKLCQERGLKTGLTPHEKWGQVRLYPKEVLEQVFNEHLNIDKNY